MNSADTAIATITGNNQLYEFIASDFFSNTIAFFALISAVVAIYVGRTKLSEILSEYKKRRREATFGFYVNLSCYIKRLRPLVIKIVGNKKEGMESLYLLSPLKTLQDKGQKILGEQLRDIARECLHYLSTQSNQIPPADNTEQWKEWKSELDYFTNALVWFSLIGMKVYRPDFGSKENIDFFSQTFSGVLNNLEEVVTGEADTFFSKLQDANKDSAAKDSKP